MKPEKHHNFPRKITPLRICKSIYSHVLDFTIRNFNKL